MRPSLHPQLHRFGLKPCAVIPVLQQQATNLALSEAKFESQPLDFLRRSLEGDLAPFEQIILTHAVLVYTVERVRLCCGSSAQALDRRSPVGAVAVIHRETGAHASLGQTRAPPT
jgi:hypothetical protein